MSIAKTYVARAGDVILVLTAPIWVPLGLIPVVLALLFVGLCWVIDSVFYRPFGRDLPYPIGPLHSTRRR